MLTGHDTWVSYVAKRAKSPQNPLRPAQPNKCSLSLTPDSRCDRRRHRRTSSHLASPPCVIPPRIAAVAHPSAIPNRRRGSASPPLRRCLVLPIRHCRPIVGRPSSSGTAACPGEYCAADAARSSWAVQVIIDALLMGMLMRLVGGMAPGPGSGSKAAGSGCRANTTSAGSGCNNKFRRATTASSGELMF